MISNVEMDPRLGSGITRLHWSEGLQKRGHQVSVWEPKDYEWGYGRGWPGKKFRQTAGALRKAIKDQIDRHYDVVLLYGDEFWSVSSWLRGRIRRPQIVAGSDGLEYRMMEQLWKAEGDVLSFSRKIRRFFDRQIHYRLSLKAFQKMDALVCGARVDIEDAIQRGFINREKTFVNSPGLDPMLIGIPFKSERTDSIVFNGSWIARKGIEVVVRVTQRLLRKRATLTIHLLGTGEGSQNIIKSYSAEVRDRVKIYPRHIPSELSQILGDKAVFFLPTQFEGFGMATSEAMACGCSVVTTPTGFGAELESGKEGLIINFQEEEKMESAIESLLSDPALRESIAYQGWRKVQSMNWEDKERGLEEFIVKLVQRAL